MVKISGLNSLFEQLVRGHKRDMTVQLGTKKPFNIVTKRKKEKAAHNLKCKRSIPHSTKGLLSNALAHKLILSLTKNKILNIPQRK